MSFRWPSTQQWPHCPNGGCCGCGNSSSKKRSSTSSSSSSYFWSSTGRTGGGSTTTMTATRTTAAGGAVTAWLFLLILSSVVTNVELRDGDDMNDTIHDNSNSTNLDSSETIQSLNPWVRIPEEWKKSYMDEGTSSSQESSHYSAHSGEAYPHHSSSSHHHPSLISAAARQHHQHGGGGGGGEVADGENEPYFEHAMMTNLSEQLGNHAFLKCRVKNLGDRTVSWIRRRDWHILTSGRITYTNDDRFQILHSDGSDEWTLVIKFVQTRDNGTYECQVSSGRGILTHLFNLNVLVPQAHILGAPQYHVQKGAVISLVCIIENSPRNSAQYLYWYHNDQIMVNYGSGVSVHTEPGIRTHSRLTVPSAGHQHAGNYTCKASNTQPATVQVFVSDGDKTAAIQRQSGGHFGPDWWTFFAAHFVLILLRRLDPSFHQR